MGYMAERDIIKYNSRSNRMGIDRNWVDSVCIYAWRKIKLEEIQVMKK